MAKELRFAEDARSLLLAGVDQLAEVGRQVLWHGAQPVTIEAVG